MSRRPFLRTAVRVLVPVLILLMGAGGFVALRASRPEPQPVTAREKAWVVAVEAVTPGTASPLLTLYGRVESPRLARISAAITADVGAVHVLEGVSVEVGDALVTLDEWESTLLLRQREADVADMEAQIQAEHARHDNDLAALARETHMLELTRRTVKRNRDLARTQVASQSQLDTAREAEERQMLAVDNRKYSIREHSSRLAQLEARLMRARALRDRAKLDMTRTRIAAPFTGRVTEVNISPGDRVSSGAHLLSLFETSSLEVRAQIPSRHLPAVQASLARGTALQAQATVDGRTIRTALDRLTSQVTRGSGGVDGLFRVDTGAEWLQLGRVVELRLTLPSEEDVVMLPLEALYGTNRVYTLDGERLSSLDVERLGETQTTGGETRVLVRSPELEPGTRVVITQLPNAIDGLKVRLAEAPPSD